MSCLSVFLSRFKLLWNQDSWADSGVEAGGLRAVRAEETPPAGTGSLGSPPGSGRSGEGAGAQLDEDGDLDVVRRPRAASDLEPAGPLRDKVHPVILTQEEDDLLGDEAQESSPHDVIKIGKYRSGSPATEAAPQCRPGRCVCALARAWARVLWDKTGIRTSSGDTRSQ